jgi:3-methylcrotonyl-CoA carboxylase alpha subunit
MFGSVLIANRGEIARRIIRTARRMGIRSIAATTDADRSWPHWREADASVRIGEGPAGDSYLSIERIVAAALTSGAEAVHPGYGFLSENAAFAEAVAAAGLIFVGPSANAIRAMGSKAEAKSLAALAGVAVVPGYGGERQEPTFLKQKAYELGYPVMIKAIAGGGGRGMRRVMRAIDFEDALVSARREAVAAFGDDRVLIERCIESPRHIEVQVFGDAHGNVVHLFERDCSVQRRHQKVIEEAPAPGLSDDVRQAIGAAAVKVAATVGYRGAGTVEFVADGSGELTRESFFFIEMNTRLQVEHPVTERVTGKDLVEWQFRVAAGEPLPLRQHEIGLHGHAIEARLYAEDPAQGFKPSTGLVVLASYPSASGVRIDAGAETGSIVSPFYDAMLAKIVVHGRDRSEATGRLSDALQLTRIAGPRTNLAFLSAVVDSPVFRFGTPDTGFLDRELSALTDVAFDPGQGARAIADFVMQEAKQTSEATTGPWSRTDAFELSGLSRRSSVAVEIEAHPSEAELAWVDGGLQVISIGGEAPVETADAELVWHGHEAFVLDRGRQLRVDFRDPLARDVGEGDASGEIKVPLNGRVITVSVVPDQSVRQGDILFSLEAMKMEHSVAAPFAGRVAIVRIAAGQQVDEGTVAVVIEPDPVD